ncbi:adenylate/guanylate cyclase domain-containing protein [Roseofilum casamattae]|uniref:Adenylate/guanylate cyclase domain-containing protein n=1 Tax=Roseofilum casamattae BLCC-M143 TaxID=3022442 RepID=A0ABT7BSC7_9CYAN|nr:adenylate/guanylate cyclase domain-containing protein [Roseofilum casamattae]MDJ1182097.1 adenylate/guanylate cyclase domain-containing protein [Roseofilum casamattae BLCC-M143]
MAQIIAPKHIEYIILDRELAILECSENADRLVGNDESLMIGENFQDYFPETYGIEDILELVLLGEQEEFDIKAISRSLDNDNPLYIDLFFVANPNCADNTELIVFLEDVTGRMNLEQRLVQATNENVITIQALAKSENYISQLIKSMAEALMVTNQVGTIKTVNPAFESLLNYSKEEAIGQSITDLLGAEIFRDRTIDISRILEGEVLTDIEIVVCNKQGETLFLAVSCAALETEIPTLQDILYVSRDITKTKLAQQRLLIQYRIADILSRSLMLDRALPNILQVLIEQLNWDIGMYWIPKQVKEKDRPLRYENQMIRHSVWIKNPAEIPQLSNLTEVECIPGEGWLGEIWTENITRWVSKVNSSDGDFQRELGEIEPIQAMVGFPISSDEDRLGMVTLFSQNAQPIDEELVQMLTGIGKQMCQFIKRKKIEIALFYQKKQTEKLLHNILPQRIAELLKQTSGAIAEQFDAVTVLFADIVGFTQLSEEKSASELVALLNWIFSKFDQITEECRLEKIKTIGDAYMVVGGLPTPRYDHAEAIANMALRMQDAIAEFNQETDGDFQIRIGINTGPVVAGVIGKKKFSYDLWGDTVNTASRMESHGIPGQIQVTEATYHVLKTSYRLRHRGKIEIKGKGEMDTYILLGKLPDVDES